MAVGAGNSDMISALSDLEANLQALDDVGVTHLDAAVAIGNSNVWNMLRKLIIFTSISKRHIV